MRLTALFLQLLINPEGGADPTCRQAYASANRPRFTKGASAPWKAEDMLRDIGEDGNLSNIACPNCRCKGNFASHGSYRRHLVTPKQASIVTISRVRCLSCNATHAILPAGVVPYRTYSEDFVLEVLDFWAQGEAKARTRARFGIAESTRRRIIAQTRSRICALLSCAPGRRPVHTALTAVGMKQIPALHMAAFGTRFAENLRLNNLHAMCSPQARCST